MSRKFLAVCALALAAVMALAGCNLVRVDEAMDAATVVASFNGGTVTKGEVEPLYASYVNYYNSLSSMYGYTISTDGLLQNVTEQLVQDRVLLHKAAEMGLNELTAEEEEELRAEAQTQFEDNIQQMWDSYAEDGLTDDEIRADVTAYLAEMGLTLESTFEDLRDQKFIEKLREKVHGEVTATPEEVREHYDEHVAQDEASYADASAFESAVSTAGATIAWYPEGYRTVKQILVMFPDDIRTRISTLDGEISSLEAEIERLDSAIAGAADGAEDAEATEDTEDAEPPLSDEELLAQRKDELAAKQAEREDALAEGVAAVQETVDAVYERIDSGDDFQALIDEYNEDPGMQSEPAATKGYFVRADSTAWVTEFRDAAMELKEIGDISGPVATGYGVHIIRYESDVTAGAVPFEELQDGIEAEVLSEKQEAAYEESVASWIAEADVKYDYSAFN